MMFSPPTRIRPLIRAFTLIEVLFALAIGGMILVFASQFLVDINRDWTGREDSRYFEEHVSGVVRFIEGMLRKNIGDPRLAEDERYPVIELPPGMPDTGDPAVKFRFVDGTPLLVGLDDPEGPVVAYFTVEDEEGLVIYWYSELREERVEDVADMNRTLVTPWLSAAKFIYYNEEDEAWEEEDEILTENDEPVYPDRVELTFKYNDEIETSRTLVMPRIEAHAFLY